MRKNAAISGFAGMFITILVIALLLLMAPANAFNLTLGNPSNTKPFQGEKITFQATLNILTDEIVPVQEVELVLGKLGTCRFLPDGTPIEGCDGLTIVPDVINAPFVLGDIQFKYYNDDYDFGYGYGYGKSAGIMSYNVTMDTSKFKPGAVTVILRVRIEENTFSSQVLRMVIKGHGGFGRSIPGYDLDFADRVSKWLDWNVVCSIEDDQFDVLSQIYNYDIHQFYVDGDYRDVMFLRGDKLTKPFIEKTLGEKLEPSQCQVVRGNKVTALLLE
jgi:hypothetical protein